MTQLTKKKLKEIMLQVIADSDNCSEDEWYATDREFAAFGIERLATKLGIEFDPENEE